MDVRIEQVSAIPLAVVKRRAALAELSKVIPDACGIVWSALKSHGVAGAGRHVALYWDCVFNLDIGVELEPPFEGVGDVVPSATPGGEVAAATHFGPYHLLSSAHQAVHQWCAKNNREMAGPSWEVYGHWTDEWCNDPSKIQTDVFYLLKPSSR